MTDKSSSLPPQEARTLREALVAAVPWLFEHGHHTNPQCYRGSDDGCWCGLDEAKKIVEVALAESAPQEAAPLELGELQRWSAGPLGVMESDTGPWVKFEDVEKLLAERGLPVEETKK